MKIECSKQTYSWNYVIQYLESRECYVHQLHIEPKCIYFRNSFPEPSVTNSNKILFTNLHFTLVIVRIERKFRHIDSILHLYIFPYFAVGFPSAIAISRTHQFTCVFLFFRFVVVARDLYVLVEKDLFHATPVSICFHSAFFHIKHFVIALSCSMWITWLLYLLYSKFYSLIVSGICYYGFDWFAFQSAWLKLDRCSAICECVWA